ncbi:MAG: glycosyl transferase [Acidocella sp. 20-57-95]|nr:MAG: glycosyl transferase [Acidocella sp. 20-57-95]OYV61831.1 MAG: glycosyl transferase [Acidocella sp. 21-58-7]HQT62946.1 glycosyltransferase [Acidocella sp.]HQU04081.1 glycosyltransferase [Acidocella sp.]
MIAALALCVWVYLVFAHGRFWESGPELPPALPSELPDVDVIIPARDEAETIAAVIESLLKQDYAGRFRVILVDDRSTDATASLARAAAGDAANFTLLTAAEKPPGWSGKLWALDQGVAHSTAPVLLFADADIVHDQRHLSSLVARLVHPRVDMVSEMVRLNCTSLAERALVPAFVYFFQMLYPFAKVNDPLSKVAAAAGGTVLIRREALARIGGIAAIKSTLIDDVALAIAAKAYGPIFLGHSGLATSIRPYPEFRDIFKMVSRTAFTQLRHSAVILAGTLVGLTLVWLVPAWDVLFGRGWSFVFGLAAFSLAAVSYLPTLTRYGQSRFWALTLPLIALFYMAATLSSALDVWRGTGARWKNRDYKAGA